MKKHGVGTTNGRFQQIGCSNRKAKYLNAFHSNRKIVIVKLQVICTAVMIMGQTLRLYKSYFEHLKQNKCDFYIGLYSKLINHFINQKKKKHS